MRLGVTLLVAVLATSADRPRQPGLDQVLEAWGPSVLDVRATSQLSDAERAALDGLVEEFREAGFDLFVVLVDTGGPQFSLGELTSQLRAARGCWPDCVYLTAHRVTLHSSSNWYSYRQARALAMRLQPAYDAAPIQALVSYGQELLKEGRSRTRHRQLMLAGAAVALCGLGGVLLRARRRFKRQAAPAS